MYYPDEKNTKIKAGKFKGMDKRDIASMFQNNNTWGSRKKKKKNKAIDLDLNKTYGKWLAITENKRSFFVWKGKYSGSFKEAEIAAILKEENLRFYREISFDLKRRFDFYIPLIDLIIEYDGKEHFTNFYRMEVDKEKNALLKRLGVKIIRYDKRHDLAKQIRHDLIYHPILINQ